MEPSPSALRYRLPYLLSIALLLSVAAACGVYILLPYDTLKAWYLGLNACFYRHDTWDTAFFSPLVKQKGRLYATGGIVLSLSGIFLALRALRRGQGLHFNLKIPMQRRDYGCLALLWLAVLLFWVWGQRIVRPGFDEVFSAINCAGLHPFQTWSYYMLPNNHVFYNLLNNVLFFFADDKVFSGRLISLVCYLALVPVWYLWLRQLVQNRLVAVLITLLLCQQFPVWAFGIQARGYELYLLCEWVLLLSAIAWFRSGNKSWLLLTAAAVFLGYATVITFLYFHITILVICAFLQLRYRDRDFGFWKFQLMSLGAVFLFYLPLLCFSGAAALADNPYVKPETKTYGVFFLETMAKMRETVQYTFSGFVDARNTIYLVAFFSPLLLLLWVRKREKNIYGVFYLVLWVLTLALIVYMKRFPFMRNLSGHHSMTFAFSLLAFYEVCRYLALRVRFPKAAYVATVLVFLALSWHFLRFNHDHVNEFIYYYDADPRYKAIKEGADRLPADAVVGLSYEGFYWEYIFLKKGTRTAKCPDGSESYYIKQDSEPAPAFLPGYSLQFKVQEYEIYKRNN